MWKSIGLFVLGALLGAALLFGLLRETNGPVSRAAPKIPVTSIPTLSEAETASIRASGFAELGSITAVLALPSEFTRREALYALAGRSGPDALQQLIFEAERVDDEALRDTLLGILFRRLAEADPKTALALARVEPFQRDSGIEQTVWKTLARNDLDEALFMAKTQTREDRQRAAARALYGAYGYMNNDTTARIREELGIEQDRQTRLRYLRTLLEDSPDRVIAFIDKEPSTLRRREYINWFAFAVDVNDEAAALAHAASFDLPSDAQLYESFVGDRFARINPAATLDRLLAGNTGDPMALFQSTQFQSAVAELVARDTEAAKALHNSVENPQLRTMTAFLIARELAGNDPREALDWIDTLDIRNASMLRQGIVSQIAQTDPEFALEAAKSMTGTGRQQAITTAIAQAAKKDPDRALAMLSSLKNERDAGQAQLGLARSWLQTDPDATVAWMKTLPAAEAATIAGAISQTIGFMAPQEGYRMLEFLDGKKKVRAAKTLVRQMASTGDLERARSLVSELRSEAGMADIEAGFVAGLAKRDPDAALQAALQIQDEKTRNSALSSTISQLVETDPERSVMLLDRISDTDARQQAISNLAMRWSLSDPAAARQWAAGLPAGKSRDLAISGLLLRMTSVGAMELDLVRSIGDSQVRSRALSQLALTMAKTDTQGALRLVDELDLPEREKSVLEQRVRAAN